MYNGFGGFIVTLLWVALIIRQVQLMVGCLTECRERLGNRRRGLASVK